MQLDQKALIEEAVQASIDAGLAVNGEYGVAAARHAARFMFNALQAMQPVPVVTEDSMRAGWNACRKSIYAVCEDVQNEAERLRVATKPGTASEEQHAKGYYAGQHYAAKSIARGFNSMEAEDDDNFRAALTATASAEPVVTTITAATIEKACTDPIEIWPTGWRETYPALASPNVGTVKARLLAALSATASAEPVITDELRGQIAYQLTKRLVIDMPTARACVDDALKGFVHAAPLPAQGGKADD